VLTDDDDDYEPSFQQRGVVSGTHKPTSDYSPPSLMYSPSKGHHTPGHDLYDAESLPPASPADASFGSDSANLLNKSGGFQQNDDEDPYGNDTNVGGGFGD
jgi:hypothetical protein